MPRKLAAVLAALAVATVTTPAAFAGPTIPTNCQQLNDLLHIDNVKDCGS